LPLEFKKINKPLLFVTILLTPSFALTTIDGKKVDMADHPPTKEDVDKLQTTRRILMGKIPGIPPLGKFKNIPPRTVNI